MSKVINANEKNFFEVINKNTNILLEFYAPWCGPCKMISSLLDEISELTSIKTKIVKINVDDSPNIATAFEVRKVPSFFFLKNGKNKEKFNDSLSEKSLLSFIKKNE